MPTTWTEYQIASKGLGLTSSKLSPLYQTYKNAGFLNTAIMTRPTVWKGAEGVVDWGSKWAIGSGGLGFATGFNTPVDQFDPSGNPLWLPFEIGNFSGGLVSELYK